MCEEGKELFVLELVFVVFDGVSPHMRYCLFGHAASFVVDLLSVEEAVVVADKAIDPGRMGIDHRW